MPSDAIRDAVQRNHDAMRALDEALRPLEEGLPMTPDRAAVIEGAFAKLEEAKKGYHDALRSEGFSPPHDPPR